jgi:hypothetical protein
MADWLLLHYNISTKRSAGRVYVWRKLKRLGALLLQDAIWVLPYTPRTAEHFRWLVTEIQEMNGEAMLWRASLVLGMQEEVLVQRFVAQVEKEYAALLEQLTHKRSALAELSRQYQLIQVKDYFDSDLGKKVRTKLIAQRGRRE